jgi:hypothetical protein
VLLLEVLVGELLSVDGFSTSALAKLSVCCIHRDVYERRAYIATGEIAALKHELRDDAVERGAFVSETVGASAQLTEVLRGLRDNLVVQVEGNAALLDWKASQREFTR